MKGDETMYQKMIVIGNLGGDPTMQYMEDGTAVTNFSLATNRKWTDKQTGEVQEEATWFRVSVWGRQAEAANTYLSKGRQVMVEGRLRPDPTSGGPRLWTRQDGTVGASFELTVTEVKFLGGNGNGNGAAGGPVQEEDDIPF
jgi:single-strand DNA-binding protein